MQDDPRADDPCSARRTPDGRQVSDDPLAEPDDHQLGHATDESGPVPTVAPDGQPAASSAVHDAPRTTRVTRAGTWKKIGGVLGAVGAAITLLVAGLSLARDLTDFTLGANAPTETVYVRPWKFAELDPAYEVRQGGSASCVDGYVSSDPEVLRCFTDESVYDPCWPEMSRDQAICLAAPWTQDGILLDLVEVDAAPADSQPPAGKSLSPWAVELDNESRCLYISGATGSVAGMRLNYDCGDGLVVGDVKDAGGSLQALFNPNDSSEISQVRVRKLWY